MASVIKDSLSSFSTIPDRLDEWMESPADKTTRVVRTFVVGSGMIVLGGIIFTAALATMGVITAHGIDLTQLSFSMQTLPFLALGLGLSAVGISLFINKGVSCLSPKSRKIAENIASTLAVVGLVASIGLLYGYIFGHGANGFFEQPMLVFATTVLSVYVGATMIEKLASLNGQSEPSYKALDHQDDLTAPALCLV